MHTAEIWNKMKNLGGGGGAHAPQPTEFGAFLVL